jgi:hypothetical protein
MGATRRVPVWLGVAVLIIALIIVILLEGSKRVSAQEDRFTRLYSETFDDPIPAGWELDLGWRVGEAGGARALIGVNDSDVFYATAAQTRQMWGGDPYTLFIKFRTSTNFYASILKRERPDRLVLGGYGIQITAYQQRLTIYLLEFNPRSASFEEVARSEVVDFNPREWHWLQVQYEAGAIDIGVYPDGARDPVNELAYKFGSLPEPGHLEFGVLSGEVLVDEINIDGPLPTFLLSGHVYDVSQEDRVRPVENVQIAIFGATSPYPVPGLVLGETWTNQDGFYALAVPSGYPFYSIRHLPLAGYELIGATSLSGRVLEPHLIEIERPFEGQVLTGNDFFVLQQQADTPIPSRTPTRTSTSTSTRTLTATLTPTPSRTPTQSAPIQQISSATPSPPIIPAGNLLTSIGELCDDERALLCLAISAGGMLAAWMIIGRLLGPGDPSRPPRPLPPTPGLPPIRLANAWLTNGTSQSAKPLRQDTLLQVGSAYTLNVQVQPRQKTARGRPSSGAVPLDFVLFLPDGDFTRQQVRRYTVVLPPSGAGPVVRFPLAPLRTGLLQVRVGIYYRNILLQSLTLALQVVERRWFRRRQKGAIRHTLDYVASSRFLALERLDTPRLNVFTNQAPDGTHWIGLFSGLADSPDWLQQGTVHTFPAEVLQTRAAMSRDALRDVAGRRMYRMDHPLPPEGDALVQRENDLVRLAVEGYRLFDDLFFSAMDSLSLDELRSLSRLLARPGIIAIARCRDDRASFPWSALYSYEIDVDQALDLRLCAVFKDWLANSAWADRTHPETADDFLSQPLACRARPECPLSGDAARQTVCPFGFWGILHQIEQPLQLVRPQTDNHVPEELLNPAYEAQTRIEVAPQQAVRLGMAVYTGFTELPAHQTRLRSLAGITPLELSIVEAVQEALEMLQAGGRHLLYFFCHGDVEGDIFRLRLGTPAAPGALSTAALNPLKISWPPSPQPLVFLNSCESLAITPEIVHGFLGKLRLLGAAGVVGVEIANWSGFARLFAEVLLQELLSGSTLGEAFLHTRRLFLRQGNPLGLVYTLHGPATLHLHKQEGCLHCQQP